MNGNQESDTDDDRPNGAGKRKIDELVDATAEEKTTDEKRMEMNRQRAKDIRKRKKKMVEDMQNQIIHLTLENNKLRTQTQIQQIEINILREKASMPPQAVVGNTQQPQVRTRNEGCYHLASCSTLDNYG